jgi:hypothetical protein
VKSEWRLPPQLTIPATEIPERRVETVLVALEQPLLVLLRDGGGNRFLGLQVDADANHTRWLHTPVHPLELEALALGVIPVRSVFSLRDVWVVDYRDSILEHPSAAARVDSDSLPAGVLPVPGVRLPDRAPDVLKSALRIRESKASHSFRVVGKAVAKDNTMSFLNLARVMQTIQDLWSALYASLPSQPVDGSPTLAFAGVENRSLGLLVRVNRPDVFEKVAHQFADITERAYGKNPDEALVLIPEGVAKPCANFARAVTELGIEVMAESQGCAPVFFGHFAAETIEEALTPAPDASEMQAVEAAKTAWTAGFFEALSIKGHTFRFHETDRGEIDGRVSTDLIEKLENGLREVRVGHMSRYRALILTKTAGMRVSHRLMDFEEPDLGSSER